MQDKDKKKEQLVKEVVHLQERVGQLETSEAECRRAEAQIKQQSEFLNLVLESLPHPFYVIDVSDYTIRLANSATYTGPLSKDTTCYALTHRSDRPCGSEEHPCPLDIVKKTKQPVTVEHVHYDRDGNARNVEVHAYPIFDDDGNVSQIIESSLDITDRKEAEKAIRKKNEELRNFVNVVSHDLKNPIFSIEGFCTLLLKKYHERLGTQGLRYLEQIKASAHQMQNLVSDLLRLESVGEVQPTFGEVPSREIVGDVTSSLEDRLTASGVKFKVADDLPTIHCARERIYQVFENLFVNAIKFTAGARNPMVEIGYEDRGGVHQFYVRDNGIGIDPKYHKKIFEMFLRLNEIQDDQGTGLGLAIVDRIVSNHGGTVWVESEEGQGATFYFTLPKAPITHKASRG